VAQTKNCPFGVKPTFEIKNVTTTADHNGILRCMFPLTSVPLLEDVGFVFLLTIVVLIPNGKFWVVLNFHSVSEMYVMWPTALR